MPESMDMILVFAVLVLSLGAFVWGKFRHDVVAIVSLLLLILLGLVPAEGAFSGFAHPAVVTVAAILVVSRGLQNSGLIELIGRFVMRAGKNTLLQLALLCIIVCFASAFMNNVGALAVIMPVAIHIARKKGNSPSILLMPIAFASLLGGMITLIGTPPNIIISGYRNQALGQPFALFDFFPVGVGVSVAGLLFIILIGWRLIPKRQGKGAVGNRFSIEDYITEVEILEGSKLIGKRMDIVEKLEDLDILVLQLVRNGHMMYAPRKSIIIKAGDIISLEVDSEGLKNFVDQYKIRLVGRGELPDEGKEEVSITTMEAVVMGDSKLLGFSASKFKLRDRMGINLLAISRQDHQIRKRIDHALFKTGDVLLLQGDADRLNDSILELGCLPLADRNFEIGRPKRIASALLLFATAIALVVLGWLPVHIAFVLAAVGMTFLKIIPLREVYTSIDWPVIILLGAMLPLGTALETTGGAAFVAESIHQLSTGFPEWGILAMVYLVTMLLSNVINNAATAVLMAPIGVGLAENLQVSADPFLMTISVAASAAFMTPIGHQSNTLVMGPGGYTFSDYFRMGFPVSIIVGAAAIPLILRFWPL